MLVMLKRNVKYLNLSWRSSDNDNPFRADISHKKFPLLDVNISIRPVFIKSKIFSTVFQNWGSGSMTLIFGHQNPAVSLSRRSGSLKYFIYSCSRSALCTAPRWWSMRCSVGCICFRQARQSHRGTNTMRIAHATRNLEVCGQTRLID